MSIYEEPKVISYYRSKDPLENLKIRVTIRRVVPEGISGNATFHAEQLNEPNASPRDYSKEFVWQEKVFSRRELQEVDNGKTKETAPQKRVHERIALTETERLHHGGRLFSYINSDARIATVQNELLLDDALIQETYLTNRIQHYRPRKPKITDVNVLHRPGENVVGIMSSARKFSETPSIMLIMADLSAPERESSETDEYLLCGIRAYSDGLICVEPDFTRHGKTYLLPTGAGTREVYEYTIEHASERMSRTESEREERLVCTLYRRYHDHKRRIIGADFDECILGVRRFSIYGEIVDAQGFDHDNLFIHFILHLPVDGWTATWDGSAETSHLSTQISIKNKVGRWEFGCPLSWNIEWKNSQINDLTFATFPWPKMLFEIVTLDSWNRYRVEGYGCLDVPPTAGKFAPVVQTWRPTGSTIRSQLRRFFVGGSPELDDIRATLVPAGFEGKELSKYGFKTTPSGRLRIRFQTIHQRSLDENRPKARNLNSLSPDDALRESTDRGVDNVLEAFKRARRRLLAARRL